MKSSIRQILDFFGGTREARLGTVQVFPLLNIDQLTTELRLQENGEKAGKGGQPSPDADSPDSNERSITFEIERYARKAREEYEQAKSIYEGRTRRAVITGSQQVAIEAAAQNAIADVRAAIVNDKNHLHVLRREVTERDRELKNFRRKNQLDRAPHLRPTAGERFVVLLLVFFILVESVLNGMFFAKGSETGLIGGVLQAFVLSLLNVGMAFMYAWKALPLWFDRRPSGKWLAALLTLLFSFWLVGINLFIGHMRDAYVASEGHVGMAALVDQLRNAPFVFEDANSFILTLLGMGLGLLAIFDGASLQDLYPGYARVGRAARQAITDYAKGKTTRLRNLKLRRDQAVLEMTAALARIKDAQYEIQLSIEGRSSLHKAYTAYLDDLAHAYEQLVLRYREANAKSRSVRQPSFYGRPIGRPPFLQAQRLEAIPDTGEDSRRELTQRIEQHLRAISEVAEQALHAYSTVDELTEAPERASA